MRTSVPLTEQQRKGDVAVQRKSRGTIQSIGLVQGQHTE